MAGLGGLKPGGKSVQAPVPAQPEGVTPEQQRFIDAAALKSGKKPRAPVARKYIRKNVSLDAETIGLLVHMELEPRGFKVSQSAVLRAAIKTLHAMNPEERLALLQAEQADGQ